MSAQRVVDALSDTEVEVTDGSAPPTPQRRRGRSTSSALTVNGPSVHDYHPPGEWLAATKPWLAPYLPQVGDDVVYLHEGHRVFADNHPAPPFSEHLPWNEVADLQPVEFCHVQGNL